MSAAGVLGVCLALAAGVPPEGEAALPSARDARVHFEPQTRFTLAWTHSIEKTRWEEDYQVKRDARAARATPRRAAKSACGRYHARTFREALHEHGASR